MSISFQSDKVAEVYDGFSPVLREKLLEIRSQIFSVAESLDGVGAIEETLKWGVPSYLTSQTKSGTTLRLSGAEDETVSLYVHCQTTLVAGLREIYPDTFIYTGTRQITVPDGPLPVDELRHVIGLALTYHQKKK